MELLHRQMTSEDNDYMQRLKRHAFHLGLDIYNLSIHQDFVWESVTNANSTSTTRCAASTWPTRWAFRPSASTPAAGASRAASTT
ncbi:MAG: hypothetical protein R2851_17795 [Caldilineaceae bacterium]